MALCVVDLLEDGRPGDLAVLVSAPTAIWALADDYAEALGLDPDQPDVVEKIRGGKLVAAGAIVGPS